MPTYFPKCLYRFISILLADIRIPISPHPCPKPVSSDLLIIANIMGIKWYFLAFSGTHQTPPDICMACFLTSLRSLFVSLSQWDVPWQPNLKLQPLDISTFPIYFSLLHLSLFSIAMGRIMSPPKFICWHPYPPVPQNVTVFGDRVFKEMTILK